MVLIFTECAFLVRLVILCVSYHYVAKYFFFTRNCLESYITNGIVQLEECLLIKDISGTTTVAHGSHLHTAVHLVSSV